jgi:hypothetical protein
MKIPSFQSQQQQQQQQMGGGNKTNSDMDTATIENPELKEVFAFASQLNDPKMKEAYLKQQLDTKKAEKAMRQQLQQAQEKNKQLQNVQNQTVHTFVEAVTSLMARNRQPPISQQQLSEMTQDMQVMAGKSWFMPVSETVVSAARDAHHQQQHQQPKMVDENERKSMMWRTELLQMYDQKSQNDHQGYMANQSYSNNNTSFGNEQSSSSSNNNSSSMQDNMTVSAARGGNRFHGADIRSVDPETEYMRREEEEMDKMMKHGQLQDDWSVYAPKQVQHMLQRPSEDDSDRMHSRKRHRGQ